MPGDPRLTALLLVLWLALAVYIVWTRNTLGYIILALVGLFVLLPALIIWLAARRAGQRPADELPGIDGHGPPSVDGPPVEE
jgi:hypothetical protein